jgi:FdhD protein
MIPLRKKPGTIRQKSRDLDRTGIKTAGAMEREQTSMKQEKKPGKEPSVKTDEPAQPSSLYRSLPCIRVEGVLAEQCVIDIAEELPVTFFINGRHAMTAMLSPVRLEDFVIGYLVTEQVIKSMKEIESVKIEKNRISVLTKNLFKVPPTKKTILSGCGGSTSFIDVEKLPKIHSDFSISVETISAALQSVPDHDSCRPAYGLNTVALVGSQVVIDVAEDIGRHNAIDRIIGYALRNGIFLSQTFVISSGPISSETVRKCLTANIPVIVSRSPATTLSVEVAGKTGMTVIGCAREGNMIIYTHPEQVSGETEIPSNQDLPESIT